MTCGSPSTGFLDGLQLLIGDLVSLVAADASALLDGFQNFIFHFVYAFGDTLYIF